MRKIHLFIITIVAFLMISCDSIESDAEKLAALQCKAVKLQQKVMSGDQVVLSESTKLTEEAASLTMEFTQKYKSKEDALKFREALRRASQQMNCN